MRHKRLLRSYHSFYTQKNNSLCENNQGEMSGLDSGNASFSSSDNSPEINSCPYVRGCMQDAGEICYGNYERCFIYQRTKILTKLKSKTGLERFIDRYPCYQEMFIGSRK